MNFPDTTIPRARNEFRLDPEQSSRRQGLERCFADVFSFRAEGDCKENLHEA